MAFKDMMNNYFYGKQGKADYTLADLPKNRRELFGEVLKVRWSNMVGVNLLYLIFWIPAIIWTLMNAAMLLRTLEAGPTEQAGQELLSLLSSYLLVLAPCIAITGPFNAGVTYVLRNWARDQHSFILSDFKDAVKNNWKQALAVSVISGALRFVVFYAVSFYLGMMRRSFVYLLPMAMVLLVAILWMLAEMVIYVMLITYELKFKDVVRNSVLLVVGKLPWAILIKLLTMVLPIVGFLIMYYVEGAMSYTIAALGILYLLFMPAFNKLITVSFANWLCETYLNPHIEGARSNIGLRPENWDDTEYRPEDDE